MWILLADKAVWGKGPARGEDDKETPLIGRNSSSSDVGEKFPFPMNSPLGGNGLSIRGRSGGPKTGRAFLRMKISAIRIGMYMYCSALHFPSDK